ncbi:MAG: reductive dehalogenase domain-containing protein, partial [Pseudomonadota bacterium]
MELGPYPFEALAHGPPLHKRLTARARAWVSSASPLGRTAEFYRDLFVTHASRASAPRGAGSTEPNIRSRELKGAAYYLDADHVGVCEVPDWVWYEQPLTQRSCALVLQVFPGRAIDPDNLAHAWVADAQGDLAYVRALEIALSLMGHIHALGFAAECHHPQATSVCLDTLAVNAGIALWDGERIRSPFLPGQPITIAVVTDYALQVDPPLASAATVNPLQHWLGINGARSGREQRRRARRPAHESFYPMEQVKRVATPTTLIFADEVPRVPKRAEFFQRARSGDLGNKAQQEVQRFAVKHPLTQGMMPQLRCMVPHQDGEVATEANPDLDDPQRNTAAIKALSYHLGADLTGICEIPRYAWYSHNAAGEEIEMRHRYAVVMLIDQGYDTMEGASGDDWISGCQSMRGYIRGAQIAGVMAEFLRGQGFSSRAQTNADSEVLQIPLVLLAGLGELSRIGELVLNPFVGPRFKSVVLTTNLPSDDTTAIYLDGGTTAQANVGVNECFFSHNLGALFIDQQGSTEL